MSTRVGYIFSASIRSLKLELVISFFDRLRYDKLVLKRSPSDNPIRFVSLSVILRKSRSESIFVTCSNGTSFSIPSLLILFLKELEELPMLRLQTESLVIRLLNTLLHPRPDN
jgi:hypothetical protein